MPHAIQIETRVFLSSTVDLISLCYILCHKSVTHSEIQELLEYTLTAGKLYLKLILVLRKMLFLFSAP